MAENANRVESWFGRLIEKRRQRKAKSTEREHARSERERQKLRDRKPPRVPGGPGGG